MEERVIRMNDNNSRVVGFIDKEHPQRKYYRCDYCGEPFWKPDAFRKRFCSTECQKAAYSKEHPKKIKPPKAKHTKMCGWCNEPFETTSVGQKYCSRECCYEGNKKYKRIQWANAFVPKTIICKECGTEFTTECGNPRSVFCCKLCADRYERKLEHTTERHKEYMRGLKRRREQQILDGFVEEVSFEKLYQRDQGICQICGLPVHPVKGVDNSWDGTIDHVIPLSLGGEHSMANCQLAHRICNSLKCKGQEDYSLDWEEKSNENNYWRNKYDAYKKLMGA